MSQPLTVKDCILVAKKYNGHFLSNKYKNAHIKYLWKCSNNHKWYSTLNNIKHSNRWCLECSGRKPFTIKYCQELAKKYKGVCLSEKYINYKTKLKWKCNKGHQWETYVYNIQRNFWCPACSNNTKLTLEYCKKLAHQNSGECISKIYINNKTKYIWKCKLGHIWNALLTNIRVGKWCPTCNKGSKNQKKIYNILKIYFPNYTIFYNYRGFEWLKTDCGSRQELDIYIPELKLGIEYDGQQHFGPIQFGGISLKRAQNNFINQQRLDKIKNIKCINNTQDIKYFLRFSYKDNLTKEYILKNIKSILGV